MAEPPASHGYIDFISGEEWFWYVRTLWAAAADLPVRKVALDDLPWHEDGCAVLGDPPTWGALATHFRRAMDADLRCPIVLCPQGSIMDGMHRILRAHVEGIPTLPTVQLTEYPPPDRKTPRHPQGDS